MPVMILARLAVDVQHQGAGLGKALLKDAFAGEGPQSHVVWPRPGTSR